MRTTHTLAAALVLGLPLAASVASAQDYYGPARTPTRYLLVPPAPQTVTVIEPDPIPVETVTVVHETHTTYVDTTDDVVTTVTERNPYETGGLVIAGAGMGGLFFVGNGWGGAAMAYRLHLGLAVGQAEFGLRFDLVPSAVDVARADGTRASSGLYTAGATFNYRFLPNADVHPVFGVGVESVFFDAENADTAFAFAVTERAGLELAYPISDGALALGIDVTGHQLVGAGREFPREVGDLLTFGAYADYRF